MMRSRCVIAALLSLGLVFPQAAAARSLKSYLSGDYNDGRYVFFQWTTAPEVALQYTSTYMFHGEMVQAAPMTLAGGLNAWGGGADDVVEQGGEAVSDGVFTGTQGVLAYLVTCPACNLTSSCILNLGFDNPYSGSNSYGCSLLGGDGSANCQGMLSCTVLGGSGDTATITTVIAAPGLGSKK